MALVIGRLKYTWGSKSHVTSWTCLQVISIYEIGLVWFMVFNATFNNISVIPWRSVLFVVWLITIYDSLRYNYINVITIVFNYFPNYDWEIIYCLTMVRVINNSMFNCNLHWYFSIYRLQMVIIIVRWRFIALA
jgi:hypothetical protein